MKKTHKNFLKKLAGVFSVAFFLFVFSACNGEKGKKDKTADFPFMNPDLSIEERVDDLMSRMTLEQKVAQLVYEAPAIDSLGVPAYNWWNECLHGVARAGRATVFPQAIGLAATWDNQHIFDVATVISDEARAKHHEFARQGKRGIYQGLTFWTPNINIFRDPRWGRGMETYGEDPFLTGKIAVSFVKGLQGDDPNYLKTVATPKHYVVHSGPEPLRHTFNAVASERDFWQTYAPAFKMCIREANAYSVMCAYNRTHGEACCGSDKLLNKILRDEWGFQGYVVSDCWAINDIYKHHKIVETAPEAAALAVVSGTDLNCGNTFPSLVEAVEKGLITEAEIDVALKRLLTARFKLGMFDPPEKVEYAQIPYDVLDSEKHRKIALETAKKSMVLLKNEGKLLPLSKDLKKIAVIGPNADDQEVLLGNYNGRPTDPITPLRGIKEKLPNAEIIYQRGCSHAKGLPYLVPVPGENLFTDPSQSEQGLKAEYFANVEFEGTPLLTRTDKQVDFNWWNGSPDKDLPTDSFAVRWSGVIVPEKTGEYAIGGYGVSAYKMYFEDSLIVDFRNDHHPLKSYKNLTLEAGKAYKIRIDYHDEHNEALMQLLWAPPEEDMQEKAVAAAEKADVVLMFMGLSPRLEGEEMKVEVEGFEGGDRIMLELPKVQQELMKKIQQTGKPVVLVLLNGSAVAINWADQNLPAILEAWYPGQAAGTAIADVLFGDYNPAGRLPVTFYKSANQLPPFEDYNMDGRTYRYFKDKPLYEFGYGLSYTSFKYNNLQVKKNIKSGKNVKLSVRVKNTGQREGDEVVQLYVTDKQASAPAAIRSLQGFKRIHLKVGETQTVEFELTPEQLSIINAQGERVLEPGEFEIAVGGRQPTAKEMPNVVKATFEITGEPLKLER